MELFTLTEKKRTTGDKALSMLVLALGILFVIATVFTPVALVVGVIIIVVWFTTLRVRFVEFEVSYFDGEFQISRIVNKSRRKKLIEFSMDEVIQIAPAGDRSVYKYENDNKVKEMDCYSLEEDAKPYAIVVKNENNICLVKGELDERMINEICKKYQQKVIRAN